MSCDVHSLVWSHRASRGHTDGVASCALEGDHDRHSSTEVVEYAAPPSAQEIQTLSTAVTWSEDDRRTFRGDPPPAPCTADLRCVAPDGHDGRCAP